MILFFHGGRTYLRRNFITKQPTRASGRNSPRIYIFRITPYKVAKRAFVGNFLSAGYNADLIEGTNFRAETAVDAEYFSVDNGGEGEEVKDLTACFPDGCVSVFGLAFFVEAVDLGDLS